MLPPPSSCTAMLPPPLQLCSPHYHAPSCMATVLPLLQPHMLLPLYHLYRPCHSTPYSGTHYATAPITAAHTMSPPSQLHSVTVHLTAVWATLAPPSQPCQPHCPLPHSCTCHIAMHLIAGWAMLLPPSQLHHGITSCCHCCCMATTVMPHSYHSTM